MKSKQYILALVALSLSFAAQQSNAAIIVIAPTASTAGSFQITSDIKFTVTTAGTAALFVLDEWVTSDGSRDFYSYSPKLLVSVNNTISLTSAGAFIDNYAATLSQVTPNDGYIIASISVPVIVGDTITVHPGTYALPAGPNFNQMANQIFIGSMFVTDGNGVQLSNIVSVPECSTSCLLLGGVFLMTIKRSRKI